MSIWGFLAFNFGPLFILLDAISDRTTPAISLISVKYLWKADNKEMEILLTTVLGNRQHFEQCFACLITASQFSALHISATFYSPYVVRDRHYLSENFLEITWYTVVVVMVKRWFCDVVYRTQSSLYRRWLNMQLWRLVTMTDRI